MWGYCTLVGCCYLIAIAAFSGSADGRIIECLASGGGRCEPLRASRWCSQTGASIGCDIENERQTVENDGRNFHCTLASRRCNNVIDETGYSGTAQSVATNITVVASPSNGETSEIDLRIQWEDSNPNDSSIAGYEVLVNTPNGLDDNCGCLNRGTRHVTLNNVYLRVKNFIEVRVVTRPYTVDTRGAQTVTAVVPLGSTVSASKCSAFVSNQEHCSVSQQHNMSFFLVNTSDVQLRTHYFTNTTQQLMTVHISWPRLGCSPGGGAGCVADLGMVVALTDASLVSTSCTLPGRNPPCFIVKQATGLTIQPLDASINYTVTLQRFNASACSGFSPTHLLDGCGSGSCCNSNISVLSPKYTTAITTPTSHDCQVMHQATSIHVHSTLPSATPTRMTTQTHTLSDTSNPTLPSATPHLPASPSDTVTPLVRHGDYLVPMVCTVALGVLIVSVTALLILAFLLRKKLHHSKTSKSGIIPSPPHPQLGLGLGVRLKCLSTGHSHCIQMPPHHYSSSPLLTSTPSPLPSNDSKSLHLVPENPCLQWPQSLSYPPRTPLTETLCATASYSPAPVSPPRNSSLASRSLSYSNRFYQSYSHMKTTSQLPTPSQAQLSLGDESVLIIYSPSIGEQERELILSQLVGGLKGYGISARCHDTACVKSPCQWLEEEVQVATAVLCVCNADFYKDWNQCPQNAKIPVVGLLKHLVHATVSRGQSLSKFATVLLEQCDVQYIPSLYLQGDPRCFLLNQLEDITRFVHNIPSYTTSS